MSGTRQDGKGDTDTVADRLNYLFQHVHPPDRGPYTTAEVAEGAGLGESTVKGMRAGRKANPTVNTLNAIAEFFGVPKTIFVSEQDPEHVLAEHKLKKAMIDAGVLRVALRAKGLSTENMKMLTSVIETARKSQGLGPVDANLDLDS